MADPQASPLTLIGAEQAGTPSPVTNPQSALQAMMMEQSQKKQSYLEQQQAASNAEMERWTQQVHASQQPENNEAAMWGSMANAAALQRPMDAMGTMLARVGGAYGGFQEAQQQSDIKSQGDLTKAKQAEVRALESKDQNAAMLRTLGGNKPNWIQFKDDAGNLIIMDKSIGPSSQQIVPASSRSLYEKALAIGAKIAHDTDEADPAAFAIAYARNAIAQAPGAKVSAGATQLPTASLAGQLPAVTPEGQALPQPVRKPMPGERLSQRTDGAPVSEDWNRMAGETLAIEQKAVETDNARPQDVETHKKNVLQLLEHIRTLPLDQQQDVMRNYARYTANPNAGTLGAVETSLARAGTLPTAVPQKNRATAEGGIETAKLAAKEHAKMGEEISARSTNFQNMSRLLDNIDADLKGLQPGSPIEPGKLANFNSGALSWMKAMGVPLSAEGERAVADAIALGKTNIQLSAADTKAISSRPAVFEFMQMLKANPGPELTAETIKRLTDQMRQNVRFGAQENQDFVHWHKENPLAPTADFSNYQNLVRTQTPWWNKFSENYNATHGRYPTYADLAKDAKEQGMTFNELVSKMHAHANKRSK